MLNELQVLEAADHPNITRVFELMEDGKNFFVVMEYCSGGELFQHIVKNRRLKEDEAATLY